MTDDTPILSAHIEDTLQAIAKLHADHRQRAGRLHRVVEWLTALISRPRFVAVRVSGNLLTASTNRSTSCGRPAMRRVLASSINGHDVCGRGSDRDRNGRTGVCRPCTANTA